MSKSDIVILHGWGLSGSSYIPLRKELVKKGFQVFVPDLPGFGQSDIPKYPLSLRDYAKFLYEYLDLYHITTPILIGHSFGGRVALKFNQLYPKSVCALILSGTPGFTPIPMTKLTLFILLAKIGSIIFSIPPFLIFKNHVRRWYYYAVGAKEFLRAEGTMRQTFKNIVREQLESAMVAVSVPTLLVWGQMDIIIPTSIAARMHKVIQKSELIIIPDSDHGVSFKQPRIFADTITKFLRSL